MHLYLVRHGESVGNARKLFFGQRNYPLTRLGKEQAKQAAEKLAEISFSRCCASDLSRAWETAQICLDQREVWPERCSRLREQYLGELEGLTWNEACERYGGELEKYLEDWRHSLPLMETYEAMLTRVADCVDEIIARGEDTLIVAHNGSLTLILYHLGLIGERELTDMYFQFRFGCYSAVHISQGGAKLEGFNL